MQTELNSTIDYYVAVLLRTFQRCFRSWIKGNFFTKYLRSFFGPYSDIDYQKYIHFSDNLLGQSSGTSLNFSRWSFESRIHMHSLSFCLFKWELRILRVWGLTFSLNFDLFLLILFIFAIWARKLSDNMFLKNCDQVIIYHCNRETC